MNRVQTFTGANTGFFLHLPDWALEALNRLPEYLPNDEERMAAVLEFARLNFRQQTGGPFAAGLFEQDTGRCIVIGVNRVMPSCCSSAHAEIMAISLAQHLLGTYDLGAAGLPAHQLVVSWRPCAMCFGAVLWSGVRSLMIAGAGPEVEDITGFDEGPIHPEWRQELTRRGIAFKEDVLREEAVEVFREFAAKGGFVYNARLG
ncbi:MAG: nucleoside deaminase [Candidatus Electrothrix sp. YB6]